MKTQLNQMFIPLIKTVLLLIVLELFTTAVFPMVGLENYRVPFNILFVLFLGLRLETPYLAVLIFVVQYFHSFFSVEGWEMGTIAGIVICIVVSYVRGMIHFSSWSMTMMITFVFQILWFLVVSLLVYIQVGSFGYVFDKAWRFLPQSIVIALISPLFFYLLNRMWRVEDRGLLGDG